MHNLDEAERHLGFLIDQGQRRLRIGLTPLVASTVLPALCRQFMQAQPQITLEIVDADREVLQPMVESGDLDAAYGLFFDSKFGLVRRRVFTGGLALLSPKADFSQAGLLLCHQSGPRHACGHRRFFQHDRGQVR
ncbi:LysR substrate-binding domain-containing protein [Parapusillimonas granuli]|uniref:LysR substrate-binding domain-containing protein n=1 Tax=Parapusillimonas granuli TaxID=380911 RepID=A0A853G6G5_9BURK|nr:LysR substrate-binding domain-containing protein [Parapusillimonas granuli]MBB5214356.1 DNA-binding transcriptional LysR family regulator [Parapusillimonas granuli]MEB2399168.1 LysR substrate-binding domain-containing protein [Alcaligenaceae bacterium]NYT51889.1 hypothetical protein [Parapusillimonas granuli]